MAEISVPIKLLIQNLLSLINELLNKLSNLKVGSAGFKAIQNVITSIRGEIDKLSILTAKPFVDASLFSRAERTVESLEEDIEKVGLAMSRLKFSDLELTSGLKADIKAFEDQLTSIKDKLKVVKNTAKDEFLNSSLGLEWLKIDETAFSKSLSQITNNIRSAVNELSTELKKLETAAKDYLRALTENERIKEFISKNGKDPLSLNNLGDLYDKVFATTAKGQFRYTNNGRNLLAEWLKNELLLDDSVIAQIINKSVSAANVGGKLKEVLNNQLQQNLHVVDNNPNITAAVEAAKVKYNELIAILRLVGLSEELVAATELILRTAFDLTSKDFDNYKDKLVEAARSGDSVRNTTNAMKSQLESLRTTLDSTNGEFLRMQRTQLSFNLMKMAVVNFMGFNQVLNLTKNAIRNAINHIKELDTVMNKISIVTDMDTSDLWAQVDQYSVMAQLYGTTIKGAYEVSLIYYQQGLETNDVLTLTNETLKLAKVSGLDYATTTDYMTTALRGFKMEMSEASTVVDVYSNLAAHTAVSLEELAVAMSKTASSMESVGATFEQSSAMIATMVAVTRESATNIGSAMKSIASRYGELTKDPTKLVDEEGEAMAFNKVDAALQSVGISMKTVDGLFRKFTDVIIELGEKWDLLESTQQRYIATQFAGNRQQSRFLALVSNVDLLKSNLNYAEESENTGTLQALKALDSIKSKINLVLVAYQLFYTTIGVENVWKRFLDSTKNAINTLNGLPKLFGKIPLGAIAAIVNVITLIKALLTRGIQGIAAIWTNALGKTVNEASGLGQDTGKRYILSVEAAIRAGIPAILEAIRTALSINDNASGILMNLRQQELYRVGTGGHVQNYLKLAENYYNNGMMSKEIYDNAVATNNYKDAVQQTNEAIRENNGLLRLNTQELLLNRDSTNLSAASKKNWFASLGDQTSKLSRNLNGVAMGLTTLGLLLNKDSEAGRVASGVFTGLGGALQGTIGIARIAAGDWSALPQAIMGAMNIVNGFSIAIETSEERLARLVKEAEELSNKAKEAKAEFNTLKTSKKKIEELEEKRYESAEAAEEYQTAVEELTEKFPALIGGFSVTGEVILNTVTAEETLRAARDASAKATFDAAKAELAAAAEKRKTAYENVTNKKTPLIVNTTAQSDIQFNRIADTDYINWEDSLIEAYNNISEKNVLDRIDDQYKGTLTITKSSLDVLLSSLYGPDLEDDNSIATLKLVYDYLTLNKNALNAQELAFYNVLSLVFTISTDAGSDLLVELRGLVNTFNQADTTESLITAYNELNSFLNAHIKEGNEKFKKTAKYITGSFSKSGLGEAIDTYNSLANVEKNLQEEAIVAGLLSSKMLKAQYSFLSNQSELTRVAALSLLKAEPDIELLLLNLSTVGYSEYLLPIQDFYKSVDDQGLQDLLNKMLTNLDKYSAEDIWTTFGDGSEKIPDWLSNTYTTIKTSISDFISKTLTAYNLSIPKEFDGITEHIDTKVELDLFSKIIEQYLNYVDNGLTTLANNYWLQGLEVISSIERITDVELRNSAIDTILKNGVNTKENIKSSISSLNGIEKFNNVLDQLDQLSTFTISNISLSISSAMEEVKNGWEEANKSMTELISGGIEGNEIEKVIADAKKYNVNLVNDDFEIDGTKFLLNIDKWNEYRNAKNEEINSSMTEWLTLISEAFRALQTKTDITPEMLYQFGIDAKKYLDKDGNFKMEDFINSKEDFLNLTDKVQESYNQYYELLVLRERLRIAQTQALLKNGDFSSISKSLSKQPQQSDINRLLQLAENEDFTADELRDSNVIDTVKGILSSVSSLMSDIFSKGLKNINFKDYDYITEKTFGSLEGLNYLQIIDKLVKYANLTIDETNDLILKAIEKDNETKDFSILKDLTFINEGTLELNREQLKNLADIFDVNLNTIINELGLSFDAITGNTLISIADLVRYGIDLPNVDGYSVAIQDSVNSFFSRIADLVKNGLSGSLSGTDKYKLEDFAANYGIDNLLFRQTAEGWELVEESAVKVVNKVRELDSLLGEVLFKELRDNLAESNEYLSSSTGIAARNALLKEAIDYLERLKKFEETGIQKVDLFELYRKRGSQVNFYNRKLRKNDDGTYSTLLTETWGSKDFSDLKVDIPFVMNITSFDQNGNEVDLQEYIDLMLDFSNGDINKMWQFDTNSEEGKNLLIDIRKAAEKYDDVLKEMADAGEELSKTSEAYEAIRDNKDSYSETKINLYKEELKLNLEIFALRAMEEDASFNFMSNDIPGPLKNPINYINNWSEAFKALGAATKSGYMDYTQFYNMFTEMGKLAELSDKEITYAGQTLRNAEEALALIAQAAECLRIDPSDGKYKIDMSALAKMGYDFSAGAEEMRGGVTDAIKEIADAEIDVIDSTILMLETIKAMQALGELDLDGNGLDFSELFDTLGAAFDTDTEELFKWKPKALAVALGILDTAESLGEDSLLYKGLEQIKINNTTLRGMLKSAAQGAEITGTDAQAYAAAMDALYKASISGDYDTSHIMESIRLVLAESGFTGEISLGELKLIFNRGAYVVETKDKNGKPIFQTPDGKEYDSIEDAALASEAEEAGIKDGEIIEETKENGAIERKVKGKIIAGAMELETEFEGGEDGGLNIKYEDAYFSSVDELVDHIYKTLSKELPEEEKVKLKFNLELLYGLSNLNSFNYKNLSDEAKAEILKSLEAGLNKINFEAYPELIGLKDKTPEEIATLLGLSSITANVEAKITEEVKTLLAGDLTEIAKDTPVTFSPDFSSIEDPLKKGYDTDVRVHVLGIPNGFTPSFNNSSTPSSGESPARGTIGLAHAKGTLVGELGPELIVSNGRYFVAGLTGPEIIDLADDAIVFNHLQTKSLLDKGMSPGRGKAVTNERTAASFALGNAKAGGDIDAAIAALKILRQEWQSLAGLSAQDFAALGGSGGGGGKDNMATFLKDLERWYNWLQEIKTLELEINYEESKRNAITSSFYRSGYDYYQSLKKTLEATKQEIATYKSLYEEQLKYFNLRRLLLNLLSAFSALYTFDEHGQIKYHELWEELSELFGHDYTTGLANHTIQELYDWLILHGYGYAMKYDSEGKEIDTSSEEGMKSAIEAFWAKVESDDSEMEDLLASIEEYRTTVLDKIDAYNLLILEMRDNLLSLELLIYDAIVDIRERAIDELEETKSAIKDSNDKFIEGLSNALEKERNMYDNKQAADDLDKLRRQRDVLIRSGGSASQIASLNEQISELELAAYFDKLQEQIDAIQEASDKQIEKLEAEISLQTEILEYLKKHGLLWAEVTDIMGRNPEEIARFILENNSEYWNESPAKSAETLRELLYSAEQWTGYRDDGSLAADLQKLYDILDDFIHPLTTPEEPEKTSPGGEGAPEGTPEGEGLQGGKKKWKAIISYKKANGDPASVEGIGIHDTSDLSAKNIAYGYAKGKLPEGAKDIEPPKYYLMYKSGGYNYNTGLAMLHGTSSKPEAIFNAEQTKILRDNILSNKPDSLISLLKTYNDITRGLSSSTYNSTANQSSSLVIEKAEVNLKVDKLANDYDSRLAAATIMDEMLRIASKTSANNSVRR